VFASIQMSREVYRTSKVVAVCGGMIGVRWAAFLVAESLYVKGAAR
jgi:hypothetical protein